MQNPMRTLKRRPENSEKTRKPSKAEQFAAATIARGGA